MDKKQSRTVDLVIGLSKGPCGCQWNMGSMSIGTYDPYTDKMTPGHYDRGPRTHHCMRCQAREALDADGVEYEKDDRAFWPLLQMGVKLKIDAEPMMGLGGQTFVTTGSVFVDPSRMV
jgi:hypothetical protein